MEEAFDGENWPVVLKRLDPVSADPVGKLRFEREIRLSRFLNHPGLAQVVNSGAGWIAFEPLGPDLPAARAAFAAREPVHRLLRSVAETLAYLHSRGVAHQDLKPSHILFRGDPQQGGHPVLVDMGVAGLVGGDPLAGREAVGTAPFAAPEQVAGAPPSCAADVWSLARIAVWLQEAAVLAEPGDTLHVLIQRALSPEPAERPTARDLAAALRPESAATE